MASEARHFATLRINDISDKDIIDWAKFIRKHNMGFKDSVSAFRATVYNNYHRVRLGNDRYSLCSVNRFAPKKKGKGVNFTLSDKEMEELKGFDVSRLRRTREEARQGATDAGHCPIDVRFRLQTVRHHFNSHRKPMLE